MVPFHSSCHRLASLVTVKFLLSRLASLIKSCMCIPSSSPGCLIDRSPGGPKGPPYGVSMSWFLFIHLVIVLLLLSPFNFSYHVLLLLSRLASLVRIPPRLDPQGLLGPRGERPGPCHRQATWHRNHCISCGKHICGSQFIVFASEIAHLLQNQCKVHLLIFFSDPLILF